MTAPHRSMPSARPPPSPRKAGRPLRLASSRTTSRNQHPPRSPTPDPSSRGAEDLVPVEPVRNSVVVVQNVINIYDFDIERPHDTHSHFYEPRKSRESVEVRVEVDQKPARDERCERLMREHLKRVERWRRCLSRVGRYSNVDCAHFGHFLASIWQRDAVREEMYALRAPRTNSCDARSAYDESTAPTSPPPRDLAGPVHSM